MVWPMVGTSALHLAVTWVYYSVKCWDYLSEHYLVELMEHFLAESLVERTAVLMAWKKV